MPHREWIQAVDEVTGLLATVVWRVEGPEPSQESRLDRVRCGMAQVIRGYLEKKVRPLGSDWPQVDHTTSLRILDSLQTIGPCLDLRDDLQTYLRRGARAGESIELVHVGPLATHQERQPQHQEDATCGW